MPSICPGQKWENKGNPSKPWVSQSLGQGKEETVISIITVKGCFLSGRLRNKMEKMKNSLIKRIKQTGRLFKTRIKPSLGFKTFFSSGLLGEGMIALHKYLSSNRLSYPETCSCCEFAQHGVLFSIQHHSVQTLPRRQLCLLSSWEEQEETFSVGLFSASSL